MPIQIAQDILDRLSANDLNLTELDLTDPEYTGEWNFGESDPASNPDEYAPNIQAITLLKQALQNNTHLKKLNLANRWLGDEGMRILMPIPSLIELNVENNNLNTEGLAIILENENLRILDISHNNIKTNIDVDKLIQSQLIKLIARFTQLGDTEAAYLSQNTSLLELDISGSEITDIGIKALAKHPKLRTLTVERNEIIGDESLKALAADENLVRLTIKSYCNTKAGIQAFYNSKLSHLDLDVREAYEDVIKGFLDNTYLQSFEHSCCGKYTATTFSEIESAIEMQLEKNKQNYQMHLNEFITKFIILAAGFKDKSSYINQLPLEIVWHIISLFDDKTLKKMPEQVQGCAHFIFENYDYIRQQMKQGNPLKIKDKLIFDPQPTIEFTFFTDEKPIKAESLVDEVHNRANTANTCLTEPYDTLTNITSSFFATKKRKKPDEFDMPEDNSCMPKSKRIRLN